MKKVLYLIYKNYNFEKFGNFINTIMNRRYNRLFVSNVSLTANIDELKELFEKCGPLALFEIQNG